MGTPRIVIVGTGSAGRRHAQNLTRLGAAVLCYDPRPDRLAQAGQDIPRLAQTIESWEHARETECDGVVIASPPSAHVEQALTFVERNIPVLLEKPIAPDLASALRLEDAVRASGTPVLLGYTYRWWPPLMELRRRLREGALGAVRHARFIMSAHLADWHPWERYQDFFMASQQLGGGALLDESHFLDLMLWCFGMPEAITGRVERLSRLEIETDDNVDLLAVYPDNLRVTIHLDLYGRPHEKSITVTGEQGTLQCFFEPNVLRASADAAGGWQTTPFSCERNDMFLAEAKEFLAMLRGPRQAAPTCTVEDGIEVLRCVEALRQSQEQERTIRMAEPCLKVDAS